MSEPLRPLTFPLRGTRLIEASAGTGKTFTIAALYVRLVLNHGDSKSFGRPLTPAEILVVTFTKAATEELRDRIRSNLAAAARMFRGEPVDHPFLTPLRGEYEPEQHLGLARRLELAANSMDDAAIFTIHGWAQRMLRQHAFDSGQAFNTEIEEQLDPLWQEAARDYWRTFAYPLSQNAYAALADALGSADRLAALARHYPRPLHSLDTACYQELAHWEASCLAQESRARDSWSQEEPRILSWFENALAEGHLNRTSHKDDVVRRQLQELSAWARGEAVFIADDHGKLGSRRLKLKKNIAAPDFVALEALSDLQDQLTLPDHMNSRLQAHAAAWCHDRVEIQKKRRGRMSFDDMLHHLDQALAGAGGPRLTATIRQHFPVALIDEFQDTDPEQYRIFRQVYSQRDDLGFFMIGDPKQAIYGFRGADIYTYLAARRDSEGQHFTLDTNFRSVPPLVAGVNQVFEYAGSRPQGAFLLGDEIPFESVDSQEKTDELQWNGRPLAGLTFWSHPELGFNNKSDYLAALANSCASEIRRMLSAARTGEARFSNPRRPLQPSDIAILVRDFNEAGAVRTALAQRGLRSAYLSDRESVFASAEATDLLMWLRAVAEAERESLVRDALASRTLNLDLAQLDVHNENELAWEARIEQFRSYRVLWQERGVLPLVRQFLEDFEVPRRLLAQADGERSLTNLLHLAELLQSQASQLDGEQALIRLLADQIDSGGRDLGEDAVLRLESDEDLIKVITFHKSKGLEYPLVFIPFAGLCRPLGKSRGPLIAFHDDQGEPCYADANDAEALARADRERLAEDLRLLYVALTRARHACWVGLLAYGQDRSKGYSCKLAPSAIAYILNGGCELAPQTLWDALETLCHASPAVTLEPLPPTDDVRLPPAVEQTQPKAPRRPRLKPTESWWITSYSAILDGARAQPDRAELTAAPQEAGSSPAHENMAELRHEPAERHFRADGPGLHGLPRGATVGNFLHNALEWMAEQGFGTIADHPQLLEAHLQQTCAAHGLEDWATMLATQLQRIIQVPLQTAGSAPAVPSLASLDPASYRPELEFLFPANTTSTQALDQLVVDTVLPDRPRPRLRPQTLNGMLKGYIDLTFEVNGRYYVLDYKSNWLGEDDSWYTRERMAEAMLEHRYDLQYVLYILALHRLLKSRLPDYRYESDIGGACYLFLRGCSSPGQGIFIERPPRQLIEALDELFRAQTLQGELFDGL